MERGGFVYFMTNKNNTVIYTGVTSNLRNRVYDHKIGKYPNSFTTDITAINWFIMKPTPILKRP